MRREKRGRLAVVSNRPCEGGVFTGGFRDSRPLLWVFY